MRKIRLVAFLLGLAIVFLALSAPLTYGKVLVYDKTLINLCTLNDRGDTPGQVPKPFFKRRGQDCRIISDYLVP